MARDITVFDKPAIREKLADHPDWKLGDDDMLHAEFTFKNFQQAMMFANAVAHAAETMDHHPDILIHQWNHVSISMATHSEDGITDLDFKLVQRIDNLPRFQ